MKAGFEVLKALGEPRYKIGDLAFVRFEAMENGKYVPVVITGIDYDMAAAYDGYKKDTEYMQSPEYKAQLVDIHVNYGKNRPVEPRGIVKNIEVSDCECYSADELVTEEDAEKLVDRRNRLAQEQFESTLRINEATLNVLSYPDNEIPFERAIIVNLAKVTG